MTGVMRAISAAAAVALAADFAGDNESAKACLRQARATGDDALALGWAFKSLEFSVGQGHEATRRVLAAVWSR